MRVVDKSEVYQLAGVLVAGLAMAVGGGWLALLAFAIGAPWLLLFVLVPLAGLLYLVGALTKNASPLTRHPGLRVVWALVVCLAGLVGAVFALAAEAASKPDYRLPPLIGILLLALPFVLVAAGLSASWPMRIGGVVVLVAAIALGISLPSSLPPDDVASRLAHSRTPRELLMLVEPPAGYSRGAPVLGDDRVSFTIWANSGRGATIDVTMRPAGRGMDGQPPQSDPSTYVYRRVEGTTEIVVWATWADRIDPEALRKLGPSVHPATDDELMIMLPRDPDRTDRSVPRVFAGYWANLFRHLG